MHSGCKDVQVNTNHNTNLSLLKIVNELEESRCLSYSTYDSTVFQWVLTHSLTEQIQHGDYHNVSILEYLMSSFHLKWLSKFYLCSDKTSELFSMFYYTPLKLLKTLMCSTWQSGYLRCLLLWQQYLQHFIFFNQRDSFRVRKTTEATVHGA